MPEKAAAAEKETGFTRKGFSVNFAVDLAATKNEQLNKTRRVPPAALEPIIEKAIQAGRVLQADAHVAGKQRKWRAASL